MTFKGSHILSIDQFALADVQTILRTAEHMEPYARRRRITRVLEGAVLGNLFFESSTRSRVSFGAAFERLGGSVRDVVGFEHSSIAKGESIFDTARVMAGYADVLVLRHPEVGKVREFAETVRIPVLNSGDGTGEHPTQALLDLYTIQKETGTPIDRIDGLHVAMVGDLRHGRTVHSLTKLLAKLKNITFSFIAPDTLQMPTDLIRLAHAGGHRVRQTELLVEGIVGADVVYSTRLQEERFATQAEAARYRGMYSLDRAMFERHCKPSTVLMHPLPRDSRNDRMDLAPDLNDHHALAIFRQADNGIPIRMALFALVLGVEGLVEKSARDVPWFVPESYGVGED